MTADARRSNLLDLIGRDTPLRYVSSTRGGEYAGPCLFCGGTDRLRVQPYHPNGGRWWCRRCSEDHRWHDAIAYLRRRDNLSFAAACAALGLAPRAGRATPPHNGPPADKRELTDKSPRLPLPPPTWRRAAGQVVARCQRVLWSPAGERARAWLAARGLTEATIRAWRLGFQPHDGEVTGLWVRRGIVIPWLLDGQVHHLKVRRAAGEPRYVAVRGGRPILYGAHTLPGKPAAVLCEGELDAILLHQQAGDLVGVASLGGCEAAPNWLAAATLAALPHLLIAYDADDAGRHGAAKLLAQFPRARALELSRYLNLEDTKAQRSALCLGAFVVQQSPHPKDITDLHLAGGDLSVWVSEALAALARSR